MYKFIANVRIKGLLVKTVVFADSLIHARLILQYLYGFSSLVSTPTQVSEAVKSISPQQSHINALKVAKNNANKAFKVAKERQKIATAQQQLNKALSQS